MQNTSNSSVPLFTDFKFNQAILKAVQQSGYETPTPIQQKAIPALLEGHDLLGCAQTGTGKTAAFALPILERLVRTPKRLEAKQPRVLVLAPTRELAIQIFDSFKVYGQFLPLKYAVIFGGVGQSPQVKAVAGGVDVLIATPGRLLDLMKQRYLHLSKIEVLVLDEADRMLDMGFLPDVRKVLLAVPKERQTLFFSATMPKDIQQLADSILTKPVKVQVAPVSSTAEMIRQSVMFVDKKNKKDLLKSLLKKPEFDSVIVFTRTKHGANNVVETLENSGIPAAAIHGNKSQNARQKALENLRSGRIQVLVATDIAARGIDIDNVSHVINYELPFESESYVHRIGRTARAGASGVAIAFCDAEERALLRSIEKVIGKAVPVDRQHVYHSDASEKSQLPAPLPGGGGRGGRGGGRGGRGGGGNRGGGSRGGSQGGRGSSGGGSRGGRNRPR